MERTVSKERAANPKSGFGMLFVEFVLLAAAITCFALAKETKAISIAPGLLCMAAFGISGGTGISRLFMSHPPLDERIAALRSSN